MPSDARLIRVDLTVARLEAEHCVFERLRAIRPANSLTKIVSAADLCDGVRRGNPHHNRTVSASSGPSDHDLQVAARRANSRFSSRQCVAIQPRVDREVGAWRRRRTRRRVGAEAQGEGPQSKKVAASRFHPRKWNFAAGAIRDAFDNRAANLIANRQMQMAESLAPMPTKYTEIKGYATYYYYRGA